MSEDWWPAPLSHISRENPWGETNVVVAEIKSFDEKPHAGQRSTFSVLVPVAQVDEVRKNLAKLDHQVSASGPHPSPIRSDTYNPKFWIGAHGLPSERYEPLVLSWASHDKTVLQPDPRFLMTYGLAPRNCGAGLVCWDDPAAPVHDIVKVSAPSIWKFPVGTGATVSISREFLQDYLTLRNMALVQVFWEIRFGRIDDEIEKRLGDTEGLDIDFVDRKFSLTRAFEDRQLVAVQVWGGRIVALPAGLPITTNSLEKEGLKWPGFADAVTDSMAARMRASDSVYVDDGVLAAYEGRPEFSIHPESGSVRFGTQWSVGFCNRVGRNLIRLELKKLYEGVPPHVTRHWNKFAVDPLPTSAYRAAIEERNIAKRAKEIIFSVVALGEALAQLGQLAGLKELRPEAFVGLRRIALEYNGWWTFEDAEAISRQVPPDLSSDAFLDRCMSLNKLIVEGLVEGKVRATLHSVGIPPDAIASLKGLKLLDCIVRMTQVAHATGLELPKDGARIWDRLSHDGTDPAQPIAYLFALYDLRIINAHKAGDRNKKLSEALEPFGVMPGEEAAGYGRILDRIYDLLAFQITEVSRKILAVL